MSNNWDTRLKRLEQHTPGAQREAYREYLAAFFASEQYDGHRRTIIEALSGEMPVYDFNHEDTHYHIEWHHRAQVGAPWVIICATLIWDAV